MIDDWWLMIDDDDDDEIVSRSITLVQVYQELWENSEETDLSFPHAT